MANLIVGFICQAATSPSSPEGQLLKKGLSMLGQACQTAGSVAGSIGNILSSICPQGQSCSSNPGAQQCGSTMSESMAGKFGNGGNMPGMPQIPNPFAMLAGMLQGQQHQAPAAGAQPWAGGQGACQPAPAQCNTGPACAPTMGRPTPLGMGGAIPANGTAVPMDGSRSVRELARHFDQISGGPDSKVTAGHLQQIASTGCLPNGQAATPELRAASQFLLDNPDKLNLLETADAATQGKFGTGDGKIGKGDMNAALLHTAPAVGERETVNTLARHAPSLCNNPSGGFSRADIQQIASTGCMPNGTAAPADLQSAARDLASRPELWDKLDTASKVVTGNGDQRSDGFISRGDIAVVQASHRLQSPTLA